MAETIDTIANRLGARVIAQVPEAGGGAFGAARLARIVEQLRRRLVPSRGRRAGRPTDAQWVRHPKVPMSAATERRLVQLAEEASATGRKISPMQLAAQILEDALAGLPEGQRCALVELRADLAVELPHRPTAAETRRRSGQLQPT